MGNRAAFCGKPTVGGSPCRNGPGCTVTHPPGSPAAAGVGAAGPSPVDPLASAVPVRLLGTRWNPAGFQVTPGVIDGAAREAFTNGHCLGLALAVSRRTGWQMIWVGSSDCAYDEDCLGEYEFEDGSSACQHHHVAVVAPDGRVVDINGSSTIAEAVVAQGMYTSEEVQQIGPDCRGPVTDTDAETMAQDPAWLDTPPGVADSFVGPVLEQAGYGSTLAALAADHRQPVRSAAARHPDTPAHGRAAAGLLSGTDGGHRD